MVTADELLAETTEEILVADLINRTITIPATLKILGVESDDDVRRLYFNIPRFYYGEVDLSEFKIQVNFENAKGEGDFWPVDDLVVNEDNTLTFSWRVDRSAFMYAGNVIFNLCMKKYDNNGIVVRELNTTTASLPVLKGLETSKEVVESNPSAFDAVLFKLYAVEDTLNRLVKNDGAPSDWNAAEGEPGHILNRTHYTECGIVELLPECNPSYNEGDGAFLIMGAIPFVVGEEITVNWNGTPYKCLTYGFVPDEETGEIVVFGNSEALTNEWGLVVEANDAPFVFISIALQSVTMVLPLDGSTEVTVSILSNRETVHKLDNIYLDVDWLPGIEKNDILPLQTVETTTTTDQKYYFVHVPYNGADFWGTEISVGTKMTVEVNGRPYECVVSGDAMDGFLTSAGTVNLAFYSNFITVWTIGRQTLTLRVYIPDHNKMPVEYLPDEVGTVKSVNGVAPDESGNVDIEIPGGTVKTVNGTAPDENGNVEITIPDSGGNVDQSTERYLGDLKRTPIYPCLNIYLDGDTSGMTKDNAVMLNILILDEYGNVKFDGKSKTAWQGSGSLQYPNKNLSLKLRDKNDEESKVKLSVFPEYATSTYHLKCNYADYSMVRNSVGAKMAKGFDDTVFPVDAPMVISSIPAILYLNGEFNGCYTLNTKQDDDLFGMDTKENPLTQIVYRSGLNGWNLSNFEYRSDGTETAETKAKLQRLLDFAKNSDDETFVRDFESYLSLQNAINYWIFADAACASDSLLNNWTVATWDGNKWYMLWYDLDIIFGLFRNAGLSYHPSKPTTDLLPLQYTTPNPIWAKLCCNFFDEIRERYWELRNSGVLTPTAIVNQFRTFQSKWGTEWIQKDRAKWTGRLNKSDDIDMMYGWISERLAHLDEKYSEAEAPDIPDEPDEPEKTLTSISATYSGGDVAIGTAVTDLTGIVVTAHYSDGSTATVTDYSLSGAIVEGSNTITVSYGGMTTTFTVTGIVENKELVINNLYDYSTANQGGYYDAGSGTYTEHASTNSSDFIPVNPGDNIEFTGVSAAYFDTNKNYVSGVPYSATNLKTVTVPDGVAYISFAFSSGIKKAYLIVLPVKEADIAIGEEVATSGNIDLTGYYAGDELKTDSTYGTVKMTNVSPGMVFTVTKATTASFFNRNKKNIDSGSSSSSVTVPKAAVYMAVSFNKSGTPSVIRTA